jgi:hypothetical protein
VAVIDELPGGGAGAAETEQVDHAVEAGLEQLEETLAGDAALLLGDGEDAAELALEQAVDVAQLLLLVEADGVFGEFAPGLGAVLAGGKIAALKRLAGAKDELAEAATDAGGGADVTSHDENRD